jgi:tRNA pseudouridine38-40 synthase
VRFLATVSYDGTQYFGFQSQKNALGIQEVIEKSFRLMTQTQIKIHASGRTDKGVHAINQKFHFDSDLDIDWIRVNDRLPLDIRIKNVKKTNDDFHARHDAKSKKYKYVLAKKESSVFNKNYEVYIKNLDIEPMKKAFKLFEGTHDFKGFCQYVKGKPTIKTIYSVTFKETKDHYIFMFHGNSFLKYMVRSMMGTLIEIGQHRKEPTVITKILETQQRSLAGKTAESRGLYLQQVYYK